MISTVTTSTVSTVTTTAVGGTLALIAILVLLALLIQKEIVSASDSPRAKVWGRILNVGIVPLMIGFVLIVATRLMEVLG